jgi:AcrR family transcriptional regulator
MKTSFKARLAQVREDAIVASVNRLLAEKGFESMTVDEVAADVGIAKASLYKHFSSKEELAAAAMIQVLHDALAFVAEQPADGKPIDRLKAAVRWTMQRQLDGEMPSLPAQNSTLRAALVANPAYIDRLIELSEVLGSWISEAQAAGDLNPKLPAVVVLYTLFARGCDPVLSLLKANGLHGDAQIIDMLMSTCFDGLVGPAQPRRKP